LKDNVLGVGAGQLKFDDSGDKLLCRTAAGEWIEVATAPAVNDELADTKLRLLQMEEEMKELRDRTVSNNITLRMEKQFLEKQLRDLDQNPQPGDVVWTKSTKKGPYTILREGAASLGPQRYVTETWLVRDPKGRDIELPKADVTSEMPEKMMSPVTLAVILSIIISMMMYTAAWW
jgi:hypothetical protein